MSAYIALCNWTEQGAKSAKQTVELARAVEQALTKLGGRKVGIWWTLGEYDLVFIFEAPDDATATRFMVTVGMQGNVRTKTMRCFSEEETEGIMKGLA